MMTGGHQPVLLDEVMQVLQPRDGAIYVDGTFGGGGYSRAMLNAADCRVVGIDRDPDACLRGQELAGEFGDRLAVIEGCFGDMDRLLNDHGVDSVDGVTLDLGVSSWQLDEAERGFSFRADGPLDMRMSATGPSAADIVNECEESALADIIYTYGEERRARRIAKAIVRERETAPITRTLQLANIIRGCYPPPKPSQKKQINPATRTFQALRIYINDELGELERGLDAAEAILSAGGRMAIVSFHSLEDRIVKNFIRQNAGLAPRGSRHTPIEADTTLPTLSVTRKQATKPGESEIEINPRARSARLRAAQRTDAPRPEVTP